MSFKIYVSVLLLLVCATALATGETADLGLCETDSECEAMYER
jgi:hypothetical protein